MNQFINKINFFQPTKLIPLAILGIIAAFLTVKSPLLGLVFALFLFLILLIFLDLKIGLYFLILSLVLGQALRVPLPGTEIFLLPNDLLIPLVILFWLWRKIIQKDFQIKKNPINLPLWIFIAFAIISLAWGSLNLKSQEIIVAGLYLVRFLEYVLFFYFLLDLFSRDHKLVKSSLYLIFLSSVILAILGFLQYIFFPNFAVMAALYGWDPHVKRLLSTWFDPNFIGGFFVFILSFLISLLLTGSKQFKPKIKILFVSLIIILISALVLTYSRSAFFALVIMLFVIGILKSKKFLIIGFLIILLLIGFSSRLQSRLSGAASLDETARFRLSSWQNAWEIAREHPFFGVGFNAYKYAQIESGKIGFLESHSDSGSDSSFLTILATTGFLGLSAYFYLIFSIFKVGWSNFRDSQDWFKQSLGLGLVAGMAGLIIHSQFVNSLLYPHFLEVIWIFVAMNISLVKNNPPFRNNS